ncbi:MAG: hypothetical protein JST54_30750 [Deltaproteobacteria bacterium]|nr:hypothetical protein [Deltaproteobacteria bacterium]
MAGNTVKQAHDTLIGKAERYLVVLRGMNTPEATELGAKIQPEVDTCIASVQETLDYRVRIKRLKANAKSTTADLKMVVGGTYALIESTDPKLYAKLPPRENWSDAAGPVQAQHIINALHDTGSSSAKTYAKQIETVLAAADKASQALAAAGSGTTSVGDAATAMAQLRMLIGQADLYLRKLAPKGSVLAGQLKTARGAKGGKKKKPTAATGTGSTASTGSTTSSKSGSAPTASSTSTPAPSPAPVVQPAPVLANPAPVQPSPAPAPAPVTQPAPAPVLQSVPSPTGGDVTAIAPMVNGATGPQQLNGAAH